MNRNNERALAARVKALGEGADGAAFAELAELSRAESALVPGRCGRLGGALAAAEKAIELDPENERAKQMLESLSGDEEPTE